MNEKLENKLIDFELILNGFCSEESINENYKERLMANWYELVDEIKESIDEH